jgi:hypothetical protein
VDVPERAFDGILPQDQGVEMSSQRTKHKRILIGLAFLSLFEWIAARL